VPGFNDAHCHIFSFIRKRLSLDLSPPSVSSIVDIKTVIWHKAKTTPPGQWITGTDYNEFYLTEKRHPTRWDLDEVAPEHPVVLAHRSLHACVLNSLALPLAGITRETPEPPGALIGRDLNGEPTGLLLEMLGYIREKVLPPLTEAELARGLALVNQNYLSQGITSLQDATVVNSFSRWQKYYHYKKTGQLKSRISMIPGVAALSEFQEAGLRSRSGDAQLRLGAIKIIPTEVSGELFPEQPQLNQQVLEAHQAGFQVAIHAVRQSTVEAATIALEYAQRRLPQAGRRHRIEHCSECPPHLIERLKKLEVVIATQPPFLYYGGERYLAMVPAEQLQWLYRFRALLDAGLSVAASSDSPVVPDNPLVGVYGAVTRRTESGQQLLPGESISAHQALVMYTLNAAYASFEENIKGSISPGKLADLVLLSGDPTQVSPEEIKEIKVEMTIIGGKIVWE
jgi:predicted amidohydrolase YtcJ